MSEVWRPILGYEGLYEISNLGRVRSLRLITGKCNRLRPVPLIRKLPTLKAGYHLVGLRKDGGLRQFSLHRLVLETFVGPAPQGMLAMHLDGDPGHSEVSNLRWGTPTENMGHRILHGTDMRGRKNHRSEINEVQALEILAMRRAGVQPADISRRLGIRHSIVAQCGVSSWLWLKETA